MLRSLSAGRSPVPLVANLRTNYTNAHLWKTSTHVHRGPWNLRNAVSRRCQHDRAQREQLAHMKQPGRTPIVDETIGRLLNTAAERWPNRECLISLHQNTRLTYSQLLHRADRFAAGLRKLGLKRGDRLGIWGPNHAEWMISFLAAARAGLVVVAINPTYQLDELVYAVQKVAARAVISPEKHKTQDYPRVLLQARRACPSLEHIIIHSEDHVTGTRRFSDVEELASRAETERIAAEQDEISCRWGSNIQFTSGTTGKPKATLLSHRALVNNSLRTVSRSGLTSDHRVCLNVPFFHAFGTVKGILGSLHTGNKLVLHGPSFKPVKSLEAIVREKCDVVYGTPTMWINLLDVHERLRPPPITLACGVTGGSPAAPELFKNIRKTFHFDNIKTIYGLTETTAVIFQTLPDEEHELTNTTVGHLADDTEVKIVDKNGDTVPFGVPGELWVRGYCTMLGYFADEENTRKTITEDGWLKTGDNFVLRSDGYGRIVGRLKDMLIRGGENIFPKEVEDVLMTHPQVVEAQVIGAYDRVYGEEVCACLRLRDGATISKEDLRDFCKGRMAPFKVPRYVVFVQDYPKTASGKIRKHELKRELERRGVIPSGGESGAFSVSAASDKS